MDHSHIREFQDMNLTRGLTNRTIRRKTIELDKLIAFLVNRSITSMMRIGEKDIFAYSDQIWKECEGLASNRFAGRMCIIKEYFHFLTTNNYLLYDPSVKIELPAPVKNPPRDILTESEVLALLRSPDPGTYEGKVERLTMEILYSTGIRNRELANLRIINLNFEDETVFIVRGKGEKDRVVPISRIVLSMIRQFIEFERQTVLKNAAETKLLLAPGGRPLSANDINSVVKKHIEKTGIKKKITPHCFRHTFAVHLLRHGADIVSIKEMLGHSDLTTTQIYLKLVTEDLSKMHEDCHPREKFKIDGGKGNDQKSGLKNDTV